MKFELNFIVLIIIVCCISKLCNNISITDIKKNYAIQPFKIRVHTVLLEGEDRLNSCKCDS
jgi:hypothetical protein